MLKCDFLLNEYLSCHIEDTYWSFNCLPSCITWQGAQFHLWFDSCDPSMILTSCDHLSWTTPFSPFPSLWHIWKLSIRFLTARISSQFSTYCQCSNKNLLQSFAVGECWICAEFHSHAPGAAPLKHNFSLNSFPEACEVLAYAERFDSNVTCESGGVSQLSLGCVLLGRTAKFYLPAMFDNHKPHIAVTLNLFRSLQSVIKIPLS